jgi:orotate phosphoribosyltransferase
VNAPAFYDLVAGRRGHFLLESGLHAGLWLDLDALFAEQRRIAPFVDELAVAIQPFAVEVICGALVGGAFLAQLLAPKLDAEFCFTQRMMPADADGLFQARYRLPAAYASRVVGKRVAIVDDVMSAGSALRGTFAELARFDMRPVVAGALLVLGSKGADFFAANGVPVVASARDDFSTWTPQECPLCASGLPLEQTSAAG